jgi:hypothetical protein
VLRPREGSDGIGGSREWEFVVCYVHGIMDGELAMKRNQQGLDLENFVLD